MGSGVTLLMSYLTTKASDCLFCFRVPKGFVLSAESAYHGSITMEPTSNLDCLHATPVTRQVNQLRPRLHPCPLPSRRREFFPFTAVKLGYSVESFLTRRRFLNRRDDCRVGTTAADIAGQPFNDLLSCRRRILHQQRFG